MCSLSGSLPYVGYRYPRRRRRRRYTDYTSTSRTVQLFGLPSTSARLPMGNCAVYTFKFDTIPRRFTTLMFLMSTVCCFVYPCHVFSRSALVLFPFTLCHLFLFTTSTQENHKNNGKGHENLHNIVSRSRFSFCLHFSERFGSFSSSHSSPSVTIPGLLYQGL